MRSRTGCLTCRQRKLKCDEEKPICRRCVKSSRECRENPGSVFRHQHNASMNGESSSQTAVSTRFYTYKDTFKHNAVWLNIPSRVTFINTSNPYLDPPSPSSDTVPSCFEDMTALYERLSNASLQTSRNAHPIVSTPTRANSVLHSLGVPVDFAPRSGIFPSYMQPPSSFAQEPLSTPPSSLYDLSACENVFRTTVPHSLPDVGWTSPQSRSPDFIFQSSMTWSSAEQPAYPHQDNYPRHESEINFLLRHFSEGPGRWMDIFDTGAYFAAYVPVQARQSALLEHAAIACAARAFGRIKSDKSVREGDAPLYDGTKIHHSTRSVNWQRTAAENYGAAISLILGFLEENAIDTLEDPDCVFQDDGSDADKVSNDPASRGQSDTAERSSRVRSKDVLAALAILSMYEFLDGSTLEWVEHLKGAQFLFGLLQKPMRSLRMLSVGPSEVPTRWNFACNSRRAAFWNIVKQDMLAAYINRTGTRIDTEKFIMWREAGLPINDEGSLVAIVAANNDSRGCEGMVTESLLSNSLTWLMARLVNLLASLNPLSSETSATQTGIFSQTLSQYWWSLQRQFQSWHDGLPATFRPSTGSQLSHTMLPRSETDHKPIFYEVWYSTSLCASAKQLYHMGQILLHMSMPQTHTSDGYTMNYQLEPHPAACHVCQMHGREIIGIALAHLSGAVRINSVQPLFVAGQCLVDPREQQIVVDLLHEIERTVGWSTKDIVLQLIQQWQ